MRLYNILVLVLVGMIFSFTATASNSTQTESIHFLSLTDIHFNPFYSCKSIPCPLILKLRQSSSDQWPKILAQYDTSESIYKTDTNYPLLVTTLATAKAAIAKEQVQFVVILGDFLGHDLRKLYKKYAQDRSLSGYQSFIKKTLEFLTNLTATAFAGTDVYALVGNNDTYHRDYYVETKGQFFKDTTDLWSQLIKNQKNRSLFRQQFPTNGYCALDIPNQPHLKLILLNTVLFSPHARGRHLAQSAEAELNWLHNQLQSLKEKDQKAFIAMHIPMGFDLYATLRIRLIRLIELWQPIYLERFQKELSEYSAQIAGIFAGHLHSNWFQIQTFNHSNEIPVTGTVAVSPIFGNNPGFKIYSYSTQKQQLHDFAFYNFLMDRKKSWRVEYE